MQHRGVPLHMIYWAPIDTSASWHDYLAVVTRLQVDCCSNELGNAPRPSSVEAGLEQDGSLATQDYCIVVLIVVLCMY